MLKDLKPQQEQPPQQREPLESLQQPLQQP